MSKMDDTTPLEGDELRFIRMKYGVSLTSAAKMLGTTRHYLRKVEMGEKPCKILYAKKYEQALGTKWFRMLRNLYLDHKTKKPIAHVPGLNDHEFIEEPKL